MKRLARLLALAGACACAVAVPPTALAWGNDGHRVVGAIAAGLLQGSVTERRVAALLLPGETLASAAVWADCVKGSWCGPPTPEMAAYVAANPRHGAYHYTNVPFQLHAYHDHAVGTDDDDIVQTLGAAILVLQGRDTPHTNPHRFTPRQALLLVAHLAGDLHQPLHVGAAYVGKDGRFVVPATQAAIDELDIFDTRGGNRLQLDDALVTAAGDRHLPPGPRKGAPADAPETKPFHVYWDTTVVDYALRRAGTRTPEQFARQALDGPPPLPADTGDPAAWPRRWADDALAAAKLAYRDVAPGAAGTQASTSTGERHRVWALTVPDDYPVASSALARQQLVKAGYRLAALLQAIWPEPGLPENR